LWSVAIGRAACRSSPACAAVLATPSSAGRVPPGRPLALWVGSAAEAVATELDAGWVTVHFVMALLLIAGILGLLATRSLQRGTPVVPQQAIDEAKLTTQALKSNGST
jgi:hypothetical protein